MLLPRQQVRFESTDIVSLYCYLVREVKLQLGDTISSEIGVLAENFSHRYLGAEDNLFSEKSYESVIESLKDALDLIDQRTPLKDSDYCEFHDAIEQFLYGEWRNNQDGEIWGINNFYSVWESACLSFILKYMPTENILYFDQRFVENQIIRRFFPNGKNETFSRDFSVNGKKLVPDLVISPSFESLDNHGSSCRLVRDNWDDHNYLTTFAWIHKDVTHKIHIAYLGQNEEDHTFNALSRICKLNSGDLVIDSPLPSNYYSYWNISLEDKRQILIDDHWSAMKFLNHIFYFAACKKLHTFRAFEDEINKRLDISMSRHIPQPTNVFSRSMFRNVSSASLESEFNIFLEIFSGFIASTSEFEIIDFKYLEDAYLRDAANIGSLKRRSVRKQFTYEYLLNEKLKANHPSGEVEIKSSFWIPSTRFEQLICKDVPPYLDGYLEITHVNIRTILENYSQSS
jgi:hypothetical protein